VADGARIPVGRQAVAVAVVALLLAGCNIGDEGTGEQEQFAQRADAICLSYAQRIGGIPRPQTFLRDFAVYMRRAVPIARQQNRELRALTPPDDISDDYRRMIALLDEQLDLARVAGEEAYAGREARAQAAFQQSLAPASEAAQIAERLGFATCASPSQS
jgi:hypothetical protein